MDWCFIVEVASISFHSGPLSSSENVVIGLTKRLVIVATKINKKQTKAEGNSTNKKII